jgi:hypothetical protein
MLIVHAFGGWERFPFYNDARGGNWCDFGFLVGADRRCSAPSVAVVPLALPLAADARSGGLSRPLALRSSRTRLRLTTEQR